jgi:hypothetical protein
VSPYALLHIAVARITWVDQRCFAELTDCQQLPIWFCPFRFGVWVHLNLAQLQRLVGASLLSLNLPLDCGHNLLWSAIPWEQLQWSFVG